MAYTEEGTIHGRPAELYGTAHDSGVLIGYATLRLSRLSYNGQEAFSLTIFQTDVGFNGTRQLRKWQVVEYFYTREDMVARHKALVAAMIKLFPDEW